jgi:TetR/AcrR family transcriptional regulator, ethionamide resistance regulator
MESAMTVSTEQAGPAPTRRAAVEASLLQAIEDLLSEGNCYTELSVEQIAARAGISRTAFYFYFNDKRHMLMRLVERVSELFFVQGERWWDESVPDDPGELREILANVLKIWREHAPVLTAIVETASYDEEIGAFWRGLIDRFVAPTRAHLESEARAGRGSGIDPEAAAFVLVWMTERAWYQHVTRPTVSDDALIDAVTAAVWRTAHDSTATPE